MSLLYTHSLPPYCCPYPCPYCTLTPSLPRVVTGRSARAAADALAAAQACGSPPAIGGTGPPARRPTQPPPPTRPRPRRACPELSLEQPRRANRAPRQAPAPETALPTPPKPLRRASRRRPSSLRPKRPRPKRPRPKRPRPKCPRPKCPRRTQPPLQPNRTARRGGPPPPRPPPPRLPARAARPPSRGCSARGSRRRGTLRGSGSRPPAPRNLRFRAREGLPCAAGDALPGLFFAAADSARARAVWEDGRERLPCGDARGFVTLINKRVCSLRGGRQGEGGGWARTSARSSPRAYAADASLIPERSSSTCGCARA